MTKDRDMMDDGGQVLSVESETPRFDPEKASELRRTLSQAATILRRGKPKSYVEIYSSALAEFTEYCDEFTEGLRKKRETFLSSHELDKKYHYVRGFVSSHLAEHILPRTKEGRKAERKMYEDILIKGNQFYLDIELIYTATSILLENSIAPVGRSVIELLLEERLRLLEEYAKRHQGRGVADYAALLLPELFTHTNDRVSVGDGTATLPTTAPEVYQGLRGPEAPPDFVKRVYGPWLGQGLTRAAIRHLDPVLSKAIENWSQKPGNEWPADVDLPTLKEWNSRLLDRAEQTGELPTNLTLAGARKLIGVQRQRDHITKSVK